MFTVSQYDSYSYLFYQPTFISLDPTVTSSNLPSIPVQGIRIGINGTIPQVGQAYIPLNTTITPGAYTPQGEVLSTHRHRDRPAGRAVDRPVLPDLR